jgi:ADP-heptose:LPS heptosyltransferase
MKTTIQEDSTEQFMTMMAPCSPTSSELGGKTDTPRFLVTLNIGIGDAVSVGLRAIDEIIKNDPEASGKIDILCSRFQAEVFKYDPRVNRIIQTDANFWPEISLKQRFKGFFMDQKIARLAQFLHDRHYEAVLPAMAAPELYFRLDTHMMYPNFLMLRKDFSAGLHGRSHGTIGVIIRRMVDKYFGDRLPEPNPDEDAILYLSTKEMRGAIKLAASIKEHARIAEEQCTLLLVAPDSASVVSRPPTKLLINALEQALEQCPQVVAHILPSYSDAMHSEALLHALALRFGDRVSLMPAEPRQTVLETTALIDQADVFLSGDTGLMHLAATHKRLTPGEDLRFSPRNRLKMITIFGGTNPDIYGYPRHSIIVGRGRKEQLAFRPGIAKEGYDPQGHDLFDHITPQEVAAAIISQVDA